MNNIANKLFLLAQEAQGKIDEIQSELLEVAGNGYIGEALGTHEDLERARTALARVTRRFQGREIMPRAEIPREDWRIRA